MSLETLYQELYELTRPHCDKCRVPRSCCSAEYCRMAADYAESQGVRLIPIEGAAVPFLSESGCIVPPHLRPLCTRHACSMNSLGTLNDATQDAKYFELCDRIDELHWQAES